jgi:hypothetical protein
VIQIGNTLENVLYQSPFMWTMAKFTVYVDYAGKPEVEFQARYRRSEVDKANFAQLDRQVFDDQGLLNLADTVWLSPVVDEMQG